MEIKDVFLALLVTLIWGAGFSISKLGTAEFPPIFLLAIRFFLVGVLLLPFSTFPRGKIKSLFLLSFTRLTAQFSFLFIGLTHTDASLASILVLTEIPLGIIFSKVLLNEYFSIKKWLLLCIAFISIILLIFNPAGSSQPLFSMFILLSAVSFVLSCIQIKKIQGISTLSLICYNALMAAPQFLMISLLFEQGQQSVIFTLNVNKIMIILYLTLISTIVSSVVWIKLVKKYDFSKLLVIDLMTPIFGVVFGIVLFQEKITVKFCLLTAVVIFCLFYIHKIDS